MHLWRVFADIESQLWDLHGLKHVVTPELAAFAGDTGGVETGELFPMDQVEQHLARQSGIMAGVRQRLVTRRGLPPNREVVDWMRLDVTAGAFRNTNTMPSDGRYFFYRPEYSLGRSFVNADYLWNISSATTLLGDLNYDIHTRQIARSSIGLSVDRTPRFSYFGGVRYIRDVDSSVATVGFNYALSRKYSVSMFEQYDLDFQGGENLSTRLTITRKLPRWFVGVTFVFDRGGEGDDVGIYLLLWPEGVPEVKLGAGRRGFLSSSDLN